MKNIEFSLPNAEALVRKYDMLPSGSIVLCAVSGGADSMCLLHWLSRRKNLTVHAAHFDHQLRGAESQRDAAFVQGWCQSHNIPFHLGSGNVAAEAKRHKMGIEATARIMRYHFLFQLSVKLKANRVATAHNANDNVETMMMHLIRGTSLQGLGGIIPCQEKYIRPLLTTSRADIEAYLAHYDIPHMEDSTNTDDAFFRNRVRHQLIPLLEEMNPGFVQRMAQTIPRFREDEEALAQLTQQLLRQATIYDDGLSISADALAEAPTSTALRCIRILLEKANKIPRDYTSAHIEAILSLCRSSRPSGRLHLPYGLTALREYDRLLLTRTPAPTSFHTFAPSQGENPVPGTAWTVILNAEPWPGLVVRPRQTGDTLTLQDGHSRSLKKLFIDQKIPRPLRDTFPLAADDDGVIFAAPFGPNTAHPHHRDIQIINTREKLE